MNKGAGERQTNQGLGTSAILHRIGKAERSAVEDCVRAYGNLVWALAKKFTRSSEQAEKLVMEIFADIWACAAFYEPGKWTEENYILRVAVRRLFKQSACKR